MPRRVRTRALVLAAALALWAAPAVRGQETPASPAPSPLAEPAPSPAPTEPEKEPSVKVGGMLFTDFTYTAQPSGTGPDGRPFDPSAFNVSRAYVNVTGTVARLLAFRITPDIAREAGAGSSLSGSLTFRLKYAYAQLNLDEWLGGGAWVRLGMQQTPWIDFTDTVYRYRFQGPVMADREGYLSSSDLGFSARYELPGDYGDLHAGVYNGETYARPEANDQKALQVRATLRPLPGRPVLKGLRVTAFYDADRVARALPRNRFIGALTFEHTRVTASAEVLAARDQAAPDGPEIEARGYSVFLIPRLKRVGENRSGLEALLRYDLVEPDRSRGGQRRRVIAGLAYWLPLPKGSAAALLADMERVSHDAALERPDERRFALHALLNF